MSDDTKKCPGNDGMTPDERGALRLRNAKRRALNRMPIDKANWPEMESDLAVYREHLAMAAEERAAQAPSIDVGKQLDIAEAALSRIQPDMHMGGNAQVCYHCVAADGITAIHLARAMMARQAPSINVEALAGVISKALESCGWGGLGNGNLRSQDMITIAEAVVAHLGAKPATKAEPPSAPAGEVPPAPKCNHPASMRSRSADTLGAITGKCGQCGEVLSRTQMPEPVMPLLGTPTTTALGEPSCEDIEKAVAIVYAWDNDTFWQVPWHEWSPKDKRDALAALAKAREVLGVAALKERAEKAEADVVELRAMVSAAQRERDEARSKQVSILQKILREIKALIVQHDPKAFPDGGGVPVVEALGALLQDLVKNRDAAHAELATLREELARVSRELEAVRTKRDSIGCWCDNADMGACEHRRRTCPVHGEPGLMRTPVPKTDES